MKRRFIWLLLLLPFCVSAQDVTKLNLDQSIQYALANSTDAKNAKLDVENSKQEVRGVVALGLPQVTASGNFTHNLVIASQQLPDFISPAVYGVLVNEGLLSQDRFKSGSPQTVQFGAPSSLTGSVNLNQLVFDGTYLLGLKAAKEYVLLADLLENYTQATLLENVQKSFYAALIAEQNLNLMNESLKQINKTYEETKVMFETGFVEQLDVDRLLLSKKTLENRAQNLKIQHDILMQMFKFTIGMDINKPITLVGNLDEYLAKSNVGTTNGIEHRAEYKVLKQQLVLDSLNIRRYKMGYIPTVSLNAAYQKNSFASSAEFKGLGKTWNPGAYYGVNLNIPIFDGFSKDAKISQAKIQYEKDKNTLAQTTNQLMFQAEQAQLSVKMQNSNLETSKSNRDLAIQIYKTTLVKFNNGLASSFELIQADNDKVSAEIEYSNAIYQRLLAQIELDKSLGQLNPNK